LELLSETLGVSDLVTFVGRIPNDQLPKYLEKCPLYISVPKTEGASSSLMEAMASGCFPIVTNLPGNKSFVENGKNGLLTAVNSTKDLVAQIERVYLRKVDLEQAAITNRRFSEKHLNREKNMLRFIELYNLKLQKAVKDS
jgi:glycosyltransferase involved in cell wall biosynthesis